MKISTYFIILLLIGTCAVNAQTLVTGNATLERLEKGIYTISKSDGISKTIELNGANQNKIPGMLAVLFEDCNSMREDLFNTFLFSERSLIDAVNNYNSCDYSAYAPTENELDEANSINMDFVKLYGGFGIGLKSISFFESDQKETLTQYGGQIGVTVSPHFVGNLQGNLYFNFQATMGFGGEKSFTNSVSPTSFSVNTYRLAFGTEYYFNKKGKINPFIGVGIGLAGDNFKGNVDGIPFKIDGGNPIWMPKAGVLFALGNGNDIGFTVDYIPEYDNDLSFPNGEDYIPLVVKSRYINFGLNYYY
jgi:hypothetical protein